MAEMQDFYSVLSIPRTASPAEIKRAYHRTLLLFHPDKTNQHFSRPTSPPAPVPDIALIKEAYTTLSTPHLRARYDHDFLNYQQQGTRSNTGSGPRPAQVVSLEDFEMQRAKTEAEGEAGGVGEDAVWSYTCRCGGVYRISSDEMERGNHLIGCTGCSEVVWVGYELADDDSIAA